MANKDMAAITPLERKRKRKGADIQIAEAGIPEAGYHPEDTFGVTNIEDVRGAIGQKNASLTATLAFHHPDHFGDCTFDRLFTAEFGNNKSVNRSLLNPIWS